MATNPEDEAAAMAEGLKRSVAKVDRPAEAAKVLDRLEARAGDATEQEVADRGTDPGPASVEQPVPAIERAGREAAGASPEEEAVSDSAVERLHHDPQSTDVTQGRELLQEELVSRLNPFERVDTMLFLAINRLPHTAPADAFFRRLSWVFTGGYIWAVVPLADLPFRRDRAVRALVLVMPALWATTALLEYPVKHFFRRRRPFISIVRAIVVGRKSGSYSFPSGHSAAAFGGAVLLACHYPRAAKAMLLAAGLVGFSRVYLGAHYPGDVVTGGALGVALGGVFRQGLKRAFGRWLGDRR